MLDADIVIAAENTRFKLPEASLGVFVTGGISALLPAAVGLARAKAMLLLGEEFSAAQALAWGLVWAAVPLDDLHATTLRHAHHLAGLDPQVVWRFKRVLNEVGGAGFDRAIALESVMQRELMAR
jgi:2-(1,2-epoxy-1,2-dihydrophenyl)acetyl-CoA isomerase